MNVIPDNQFSTCSGVANWRSSYQQALIGSGGSGGYIQRVAPVNAGYPCTFYWANLPGYDPEEINVFDTACGILSVETILQCPGVPYGPVFPSGKLRIVLESPAQVYIVNDKGMRAGCVNGVPVTEIPGSSVPSCEEVVINGTVDGTYTIKLKGTANGSYHINAESYLEGGLIQRERGAGNITIGEEQELHLSLGRIYWPMTISTDFKKDLLEIAYKPGQTNILTNNPRPYLRIYNNGTRDINMAGVKARYWYTYEGTGQAESASVTSSLISTGQNITANTQAVINNSGGVSGTDRYMEISFLTDGIVLKPGQYVDVQAEFHKADMSNYDQSNDYSFRVTSDYQLWDHVTGYLLDNLVWGIKPSLILPTPTATITASPTFTITTTPTEIIGTLTPYPVPTVEITVNISGQASYVVYGPTPVIVNQNTYFSPTAFNIRYYFPFATTQSDPFVFTFHMDPGLLQNFYISSDGMSGIGNEQTDGKSLTATVSALSSPYFIEFFMSYKGPYFAFTPGVYHNTAYIAPNLTVTPQKINIDFEIVVATLTVTPTPTVSPTFTETGTITVTFTDTPVVSPTDTGTVTETATVTATNMNSATATKTFTGTPTFTVTPTATPTSTAILDSYEPDNVYTEAKTIQSGIRQVHSIDPPGDVDWVKFDILKRSDVTIETSGPVNADTIIWLYDSTGVSSTFLIMNDDGGQGNFSKITATLDPGTYYLQVRAYDPTVTIQTYYIDLTVNVLATVTTTETGTETTTPTPTVTQSDTETPTFTATPTQTSLPAANLRAQYFSYHTDSVNNTIYINVRIYNDGTESVTLSNVTAKYWYTFEGSGAEVVEIDDVHKQPSGQDLKLYTSAEIQIISQSGQDRVQITSFGSGADSLATGEFVEVHLRVHKTDWTNYSLTNDYSFGTQTEFQNWQQVTLYYSGTKVWGLEPGEVGLLSVRKSTPTPVIAEPLSNINTYNYPNPCSGRTSIRFSLEKPVDANITIYDMAGKLVWTKILKTSETRAGINVVVWDILNDFGAEVANGVYILKISADGRLATKKIAVVQ